MAKGNQGEQPGDNSPIRKTVRGHFGTLAIREFRDKPETCHDFYPAISPDESISFQLKNCMMAGCMQVSRPLYRIKILPGAQGILNMCARLPTI